MKNTVQNMSKKTKAIIAIVLGVAVVGVVAGFVLRDKPVNAPEPVPEVVEELTATPKTPRAYRPVVVAPVVEPVETRTYADLILAFKNKTLQFGNLCQVQVSNQVHKVGTEILLDNRTDMPVTITIGDLVHTLPSYGYKVVNLNTEGKFMVSCNEYQNVATVSVQY